MFMGWVKLHRETMEKAIWKCSTPEQKVLFMTILMLTNHKENQWIWKGKKFMCKPGQFITSIKSLSNYAMITEQNVRTALSKFEKLEFLTNESTKTGRLITICNWDRYQTNETDTNNQPNKDLTKDQQRPNKDLTTNKKGKKEKNVNNEKNIEFEIFWNLYGKKYKRKDSEIKWNNLKDSERTKIIATLPEWLQQFKDPQFIPHPTTYFNQRRWEDEITTTAKKLPEEFYTSQHKTIS